MQAEPSIEEQFEALWAKIAHKIKPATDEDIRQIKSKAWEEAAILKHQSRNS